MKAISYQISLLEPTLVTELDGDPNSAVTFDHLPGGVLRGAIIKKYLQQHGAIDLAVDAEARRFFFNDTTRYLNGYILDDHNARTLPIPQSWQYEKGKEEDNQLYDFALCDPDENAAPEDDKKQWKGEKKPFCSIILDEDGPKVRLFQPSRWVTIHTARTRRFGRAMPEKSIDKNRGDTPGAVYRYDALAEGQTFAAAILCDDVDAQNLKGLIEGEVTVGKSRSGGYGRVRLHDARIDNTWSEFDVSHLQSSNDEEIFAGHLIITLLSDALLRDTNGQFVVDAETVTTALNDRLQSSLSTPLAFMNKRVVGGFNRKWGLPLPQVFAARMGSVFVYEVASVKLSKLRELVEKGVGDRRAEGFGRVAVNWQKHDVINVDDSRQRILPASTTITPGSTSEALAKRMAERLLRQRLDEKIIEQASNKNIRGMRSSSQLSRLRNIIHDELMDATPNPNRVGGFLNSQRSTARKQFERAQVSGTRLLDWLNTKSQATSVQQFCDLLNIKTTGIEKTKTLRSVGGFEPVLTGAIRNEYVLRFIDTVLARAIKNIRGEGE
jgi:CRISPR-associated protein Csx10